MRNLFSAMLYEHLKIHGLVFAIFVCVVLIQRSLGANLVGPGLGLYGVLCFILLLMKPYSTRNWSWLKTLPISRASLLKLVSSEALMTVVLGFTCVLFVSFLTYPAAFRDLHLASLAPKLVREFLRISWRYWFYFTLVMVGASPGLFVVFSPATARPNSMAPSPKLALTVIVSLATGLVGLYNAPLLTATVAFSVTLGWLGSHGLKAIFPVRSFKKWAHAYGLIVGLAILGLLISRAELSGEEDARPALRMQYYGALAPSVDRARLFSMLARPEISDRSRLEIAQFEVSRTPEHKMVSPEALREWSEKAKLDRVFFTGLTLFQGEIWTPQALVHLESELKVRCKEKLQRSQWAPIWRCELDQPLLENGNYSLRLDFNLKDGPELLELLTPEHPLIASMLLQAALVSTANASWKPKIEALANAKAPVVSEQAVMWLDRLKANPKGSWDCSKRRRKDGSVCTEADVVSPAALKLESRSANDPGGAVFVNLSRGQ